MASYIAEPCVGTKSASCVAVCPVNCIYEGDDQYYINPSECIDCGECVPACPVTAIFAEDALPEQWVSFGEKNVAFFVPGADDGLPTTEAATESNDETPLGAEATDPDEEEAWPDDAGVHEAPGGDAAFADGEPNEEDEPDEA